MGLDQYAMRRKGALPDAVDFPSREDDEEIAYWRKHPNLQGWMEELYRSKGGKSDAFNCDNVAITAEDLDLLEDAVIRDALPHTSGFFFGASMPEDREDDLAFIRAAREVIASGDSVYYTSWW